MIDDHARSNSCFEFSSGRGEEPHAAGRGLGGRHALDRLPDVEDRGVLAVLPGPLAHDPEGDGQPRGDFLGVRGRHGVHEEREKGRAWWWWW